METEAFNTELFVDEIEKRPAIWDMTSSVYSDKNLRRRAWEVSIANKGTESSFDTDNASVLLEVASPHFKSPRKKLKISSADERFASILEQSLAQKNLSEPKDDDEDKLFCLSLVKEIKEIPEYKRFRTKIDIYNLMLQNQNLQGPQHKSFENQNYRYPLPQRRNYLPQEQRSQASVEGFQQHDYRSQQSSVPNNLSHYGYTTAMGSLSPVAHTPSPATTNASSESEIELFYD